MSESQPPSSARAELRLLSPGELFHGRYQVLRCIGAGGMGAVYEVLHQTTERRRVMKTMLPGLLSDADLRDRFRLEATVTARIESEHIVEVFDAGFDETSQIPFIVMEYLRGENLAAVLRKRGRLGPEEVLTLLHQTSLALERTHAAGIVHRDLKPENLFLTRRDDGSPRLKILDFGIAKVIAQSTNLKTTRNFGTPLYMSPEQLRGDGDIDGRADLYAVGQIAYTLLIGNAYWEAETVNPGGVYSLLLKVAEGAKESASTRASRDGVTLPAGFDAWFARATAPLARERFESATELVQELSSVLRASLSPIPAAFRVPEVDDSKVDFAPPVPQPPTLGGLAHTDDPSSFVHGDRRASYRRRTLWLTAGALGCLGLFLGALTRGAKDPMTAQASASRPEPSSPPASAALAAVSSAGIAPLFPSVPAPEVTGDAPMPAAPNQGKVGRRTRPATIRALAHDPSDLRVASPPDPGQPRKQAASNTNVSVGYDPSDSR